MHRGASAGVSSVAAAEAAAPELIRKRPPEAAGCGIAGGCGGAGAGVGGFTGVGGVTEIFGACAAGGDGTATRIGAGAGGWLPMLIRGAAGAGDGTGAGLGAGADCTAGTGGEIEGIRGTAGIAGTAGEPAGAAGGAAGAAAPGTGATALASAICCHTNRVTATDESVPHSGQTNCTPSWAICGVISKEYFAPHEH